MDSRNRLGGPGGTPPPSLPRPHEILQLQHPPLSAFFPFSHAPAEMQQRQRQQQERNGAPIREGPRSSKAFFFYKRKLEGRAETTAGGILGHKGTRGLEGFFLQSLGGDSPVNKSCTHRGATATSCCGVFFGF